MEMSVCRAHSAEACGSCASAHANEITVAEETQFVSQIERNGCSGERRRHIGRRFFSLSCATMKWELFSPTVES